MMDSSKSMWISWEDHRRSRELAMILKIPYYPLVLSGSRFKRYLFLGLSTLKVLFKKRPKYVFCQNPSIVLTLLVLMIKPIMKYKVIVDRHSNFKLEYSESNSPKWKIFHYLSRFTVKHTDLTIVTNAYLKSLCDEMGGKSVILPDKIPHLSLVNKDRRPAFMDVPGIRHHIMLVTMFDDDEPIEECLTVAKKLPDEFMLYFTGNYQKKYSDSERKELIKYGIKFTGFVEESIYQDLMYHSDVVVVLTKKEHILNCGAYEAYSLRKPLILSDTHTLRDYFRSGCLYTSPLTEEIEASIIKAVNKKEDLVRSMEEFLPELKQEWEKSFGNLKKELGRI